MATIHVITINGEPWHVAKIGGVAVLRNRYRTGLVLDCWTLGLVVEEV